MLYFKGKVDGIRKKTYQGKDTQYLQFVHTDGEGALSFREVKVVDGTDASRVKVGAEVEMAVDYSVMNGEVYFRTVPGTAIGSAK